MAKAQSMYGFQVQIMPLAMEIVSTGVEGSVSAHPLNRLRLRYPSAENFIYLKTNNLA